MHRKVLSLITSILLFSLYNSTCYGKKKNKKKDKTVLIVVSIDGMQTNYLFNKEKYGLKLPFLSQFLNQGTYAQGVQGVLPTLTYPSHTSLMTGVYPAEHGIEANTIFDPQQVHKGQWYWYYEQIKVPTLWELVEKKGLKTANISWPVTVGAPIKYNLPEYWRDTTPEDLKINRLLATPGLMKEVEDHIGTYVVDWTPENDVKRVKAAQYLIENKKFKLLTIYLASLDTLMHKLGPNHPKAVAHLEELDKGLQNIWETANKKFGKRLVFSVVSDHGFVDIQKQIHLNHVFYKHKLIELDNDHKVKSWKAFAWHDHGSTAILLKDPDDQRVKQQVKNILLSLKGAKDSGIEDVWEPKQFSSLGFPNASFVVFAKPGFIFKEFPINTQYMTKSDHYVGSHGHSYLEKSMNSAFFIRGRNIPKGLNLGDIKMLQIAPIFADILEVELKESKFENPMKNLNNRSLQIRSHKVANTQK